MGKPQTSLWTKPLQCTGFEEANQDASLSAQPFPLSTIHWTCYMMARSSERIHRPNGGLSLAPILVLNTLCSSVPLFSSSYFVTRVRHRSIGVQSTDIDHCGHLAPPLVHVPSHNSSAVISSSPLLRGGVPDRDWIEVKIERRNRLIQESASMSGWSHLRLLENLY